MKFKIHYTLKDGSEDDVTLEGGTIEEIREQAAAHLERVGGVDPWSEELRSLPYHPASSAGDGHASDCATHNAPAMEPGPCDCGAS